MHRNTSVVLIVSYLLAIPALAQPIPADLPPDFVPFGVYLSWERIGANAEYHGIDQWEDLTKRLDALQANHVNLLWVTNMSEADLPRLITECAKRSMRLMPSMSAVEAKVDWRWVDNASYYDKKLPKIIAAAGDSETLAGWVLSDEPLLEHFPRVETLREKFRVFDENRFCTAVTMWPQTPHVPLKTQLPLVCVDLYPFFGPNDPNGPHTDNASKHFFRKNAEKMVDSIGDGPATGWVMGQCFSDIWGPRKYDDRGHLIGLPGAYLHWRAPTLAEIRWQVWETFRSGAKGFVSYTLAPEAPNPETATLPSKDVKWKEVLAKVPTDLGPNALTDPDGSITPQLEELGRVYAQLAPHADLLLRMEQSGAALVEIVEGPGSIQVFEDPETETRYAIVINDDLKETRDVTLRLGGSVSTTTILTRDGNTATEVEEIGRSPITTVSMTAGDGVLLKIH
jgi:hypothetical protein